MKNRLINSWTLVSFEIRKESGEIVFPFGKDAKGMLIYTSSGKFSAQVMRNDRPKFKSDDQMNGSDEEIGTSFKGVISYFGDFTVDEKESTVFHNVESSIFPNWNGITMKRIAKIENDTLEISTEPTTWSGESTIAMLVWKRI